MRALLTPKKHQKAYLSMENAGRWTLITHPVNMDSKELEYDILEQIVFVYLKRWGVVFRSLMEKEDFSPPWRVLVRVLRRLELRSQVRGGRFVAQVSGEQFALPETVEQLRKTAKKEADNELISLSAVDPLNLLGIILPGKRIANVSSNRILFRNGIPLAVWENKQIHFLKEFDPKDQWEFQKVLLRHKFPTKLRYYLTATRPSEGQ